MAYEYAFQWLQSPPYVDPDLPSDGNFEFALRLRWPSWARAHCNAVRISQQERGLPMLPPCNWCGHPSGDWCESCERFGGKPHVLCTTCERTIRECRLCRLQNRGVSERPSSVHALKDSLSSWMGRSGCALCKEAGFGMQMCRRCRCVRYCSTKCQEADWEHHRQVCAILRSPQPLMIVYPNHWQRAVEVTADHPRLLPPPRVDVVKGAGEPGHVGEPHSRDRSMS